MADTSTNESVPVVKNKGPETPCQDDGAGHDVTLTSAEKRDNSSTGNVGTPRPVEVQADVTEAKLDPSEEHNDNSKDLSEQDVKNGDVPGNMSVSNDATDAETKSQGKDGCENSVENIGQTIDKGSTEATREKASVNDWAKIKSIETTGSDDLDDLLDTDIVQISLKYGSNDTPESLNTDDPDTSYKEMSPDELFDGPASDKLGELLSHKKGLESVLSASINSRRFSESYIEDQIHEADAAIDNILKGYKREIKRTQSYDPSYVTGNVSIKRTSSPVEGNVLQKRIKVEQGENTSKLGSGDVHPPIAIIEPFDISSHGNKNSDIIEKLESMPCSIAKAKEDSNSSAEQEKQNIRSILDEMDSKLSDISKDSVSNLGVKDSFQTSDGSNWTFTSNAGTPKQGDTPPNVNPFNEFDNLFDGVLDEKPSEVNTTKSNNLPKVSESKDVVAVNSGTVTPVTYNPATVSSHSVSISSQYSTAVPTSMVNTDTQLSSDRPPSLGHIPNYQNPLGVSGRDPMSHPPHSVVSQVGMQFSQGNTAPVVSSVSSDIMMARDHERRLAYAEQQRARVNMHYMNRTQSKTPLNDLYSMVQPDGSGADFMQAREMAQQRRSPAYQGVPAGRPGMPNQMMQQYPQVARTGNISPGYAQVPGNRVGGVPPGYVNQMGNPMGSRGDVVSPVYSNSPASAGGPLSPGYSHPPNSVNNMHNMNGMAASQYGTARPTNGMTSSGDVSMGPRMPYTQSGMQYPGSNYRNMTGAAGSWPGQGMTRGMQPNEMAQRMQYQGQMAPGVQQTGSRFPSTGHSMTGNMDRNMQMQMYQQQQRQAAAAAAAQDPMMRMRQSEMRPGMADPYGRDQSGSTMMTGAQGPTGRQQMVHLQSERMAGMAGPNMGSSAMMQHQQGQATQHGQGQANRWPTPNNSMVRPNMSANMPPGMQYTPRLQQSVRPTGPGMPSAMTMHPMQQQQQQHSGSAAGAAGGGSYGNYPPGRQPIVNNKPNMDNQNLIDILNQRHDPTDQSRGVPSNPGAGNVLGGAYPNVKLENDATFGDLQRLSSIDNTGYPS